jgi:hypothetical protein
MDALLPLGVGINDAVPMEIGPAHSPFSGIVGLTIDRTDNDVWFGLHEPTLENAANGGRGVIGNENSHFIDS